MLALPQVGLAVLFPRPSQDRNSGAVGRGGGIIAPGGGRFPGPGGRGISRDAGGACGAGRAGRCCWACRPNGMATESNSAPIVRGVFRSVRANPFMGAPEEGVEWSVFMRGLECCCERFPNRLVAFWQHPHCTRPPSRVCEEHSGELLSGGTTHRRPGHKCVACPLRRGVVSAREPDDSALSRIANRPMLSYRVPRGSGAWHGDSPVREMLTAGLRSLPDFSDRARLRCRHALALTAGPDDLD